MIHDIRDLAAFCQSGRHGSEHIHLKIGKRVTGERGTIRFLHRPGEIVILPILNQAVQEMKRPGPALFFDIGQEGFQYNDIGYGPFFPDVRLGRGVGFLGGSSYVNIAPGTLTFKVLDPTSTAVLDTLDITIAANKRYTVFSFGEVATLSLKMLAAD